MSGLFLCSAVKRCKTALIEISDVHHHLYQLRLAKFSMAEGTYDSSELLAHVLHHKNRIIRNA